MANLQSLPQTKDSQEYTHAHMSSTSPTQAIYNQDVHTIQGGGISQSKREKTGRSSDVKMMNGTMFLQLLPGAFSAHSADQVQDSPNNHRALPVPQAITSQGLLQCIDERSHTTAHPKAVIQATGAAFHLEETEQPMYPQNSYPGSMFFLSEALRKIN